MLLEVKLLYKRGVNKYINIKKNNNLNAVSYFCWRFRHQNFRGD